MSLPVFLGPVTVRGVGDDVVVEGDEARHAVVVRRLRVGEHVVLVDGAGVSATCSVTATSKTRPARDRPVGLRRARVPRRR